ncbi:CCA tRNA nucleotidyltransferase [Antarctobacter heliothermus]|uniref:Poly(A) polymerase n=1 Tax=Antarctobacter heliothermus TaxID=74033 RepID=A0A239BQ63_9RHOB|nr:CCA tRNA nucleotidyltransferase [Antarctobacter heliothermus]SNS09996.1 poly(A) polymerase [Antarctobacter heliothermus]
MTRVTGDWLRSPATQTVMAMLEDAGHLAYAVGGCVRNALLGVPVSDVDISTDARPTRVMALAKAAGLKVVPTGVDHGTVTVVAGGEGFEVTTFRADVETDGRRAVVRFADDVHEDAVRRDFTMNALYADRRGALIDPLGGLPDLQARHFRFILDADTRIKEDYLRILRFFRFSAWYGDPDAGMDPDALAAIAANIDGLDLLSRERVGVELVKLLKAPDPLIAISVMERLGVLAHVLPGAGITALGPYLMFESALGRAPDPMARMAVLGFFDGEALRLSKAAQRKLHLYRDLMGSTEGPAELAYRQGPDVAQTVVALRAASFGSPLPQDITAPIAKGAKAKFPLKAKDLMPSYQGAALGDALRRAEEHWIAQGFIPDKADLRRWLDEG